MYLTVNIDVDADVGRFDVVDVVRSSQYEQLLVTVDFSWLQCLSRIAELDDPRREQVLGDKLIVTQQ